MINGINFQLRKELTQIPIWVKSNAFWWHEKQIDDSDFIAGIKYLVQSAILTMDEDDMTSTTYEQVPLWLRDVAGFWSDDSITDDEFVQSIQWLINNGILKIDI